MSPEQQRYRRLFFSMDREARRRYDRPVLVHGRQADSSVDPGSLPTTERVKLRNDDGTFKFVVGYSQIDGPDVVS